MPAVFEPTTEHAAPDKERVMIVLGIILMVVGYFIHIPILWTVGIILLVIGLILLVLGRTGRAIGGRNHWY